MVIREIVPPAATVLLVAFMVTRTMGVTLPKQHVWKVPALLAALFAAFSARAMVTGGAFGFWKEHSRNAWGNQIWLDLLLAVGVSWFLIVPQAKALGMRVMPWLLAIICSGCIGLLAMLARLLYLRNLNEQSARPTLDRTLEHTH
jgi:hypothetical protein